MGLKMKPQLKQLFKDIAYAFLMAASFVAVFSMIICFAQPAAAEVYIAGKIALNVESDYRIKQSTETRCAYNDKLLLTCQIYDNYEEPENPFGMIEIGYRHEEFSIFFLHISSIGH